MRFNPLKLMAFTGAVALGLAGAKTVIAQDTVVATLITTSAITTTDVSDMDFGTWLLKLDGPLADVLTLTMNTNGAVTVVVGGTGSTSGDSQFVNITPATTRGVVNVQTPASAVLQMTRSNEVPFADGALTLTTVTVNTATQGDQVLAAAGTVPVTVTTAATDETVNFGAVITVAGAQPGDATHTASFDVAFAY